jgi:hypothetical protein
MIVQWRMIGPRGTWEDKKPDYLFAVHRISYHLRAGDAMCSLWPRAAKTGRLQCTRTCTVGPRVKL